MWAVLTAMLITSSAIPPTACATVPFPASIDVLKVVRIVTGPDAKSRFVDEPHRADKNDYFNNGKPLARIELAASAKIRLVAGPPGVTLPTRPALGYELFLTIQGSSFVTLPDGQERAILPGTLLIMDDTESKVGHGGRTGPCGYVAIQVIPTTGK